MWKSIEQVVFVVRWESVLVRWGLEKGKQARSYWRMGGGKLMTSCRVPGRGVGSEVVLTKGRRWYAEGSGDIMSPPWGVSENYVPGISPQEDVRP